MKCYTVTELEVKPYIAVSSTPYPHIEIGEDGINKTLVRFPIDRKFADSLEKVVPCPKRRRSLRTRSLCPLCGVPGVPEERYFRHPDEGEVTVYQAIRKCDILSTGESKEFQLIDEMDYSDNRALVLVNISAGYYGSTKWTGANQEGLPCPDRGTILAKTAEDSCPKCGVSCIPVGHKYKHPNYGTIMDWAEFPTPGITVLSQGYRSKSAYGVPCKYVVMLLVMEQGAAFRVDSKGRYIISPTDRFVIWTGKNILEGSRDEIKYKCREEDKAILPNMFSLA